MTRSAVERYLEALNSGDPDHIAACVTDDFYNEHTSALGHSRRGRAPYRERLPSFLAEFVGLHYEVEDTVVEDDRAAVAYTMTCTYHGAPVSVRGVFRFEVEGGLIAHRVDYWDSAAFSEQVGATARPAAMEVLFASLPVADLGTAIPWYERFFGRPADIVPNEQEVMWQAAGNGWIYVIEDPARAGKTVVAVSVSDLDQFVMGLAERGIGAGPIEAVGDAGRKANVRDPDGNLISLIEVVGR